MADTTKTKAMSLAQKILELQKSVRGLSKDAENRGFRYTYVSGSKLLSVVRPKMDELGLTLTQTIVPESIQVNIIPPIQTPVDPKNPKAPVYNIFLVLRFIWSNCETGETKEDLWPSYGQNTSLDKAIGCAMTYSERYYIMKQLHIATDEDDVDSVEPGKTTEPQTESKPTKTPQRKPNAVLEQKNDQETAKTHITLQRVVAGNCNQAVKYLVDRYDAQANGFKDSDKSYIKSKYDWDEDAFAAVIQMATDTINNQPF